MLSVVTSQVPFCSSRVKGLTVFSFFFFLEEEPVKAQGSSAFEMGDLLDSALHTASVKHSASSPSHSDSAGIQTVMSTRHSEVSRADVGMDLPLQHALLRAFTQASAQGCPKLPQAKSPCFQS